MRLGVVVIRDKNRPDGAIVSATRAYTGIVALEFVKASLASLHFHCCLRSKVRRGFPREFRAKFFHAIEINCKLTFAQAKVIARDTQTPFPLEMNVCT